MLSGMSWYLLTSGLPFYAVDLTNLAERLIDEGATILADEDVAAAIAAWNAMVPGPPGYSPDFVTAGALAAALPVVVPVGTTGYASKPDNTIWIEYTP